MRNEVGIIRMLPNASSSSSLEITFWYGMACSCTNAPTSSTTFAPRSVEIPRICTSLGISLLRATRSGSSRLHGTHHVAQKFTRVTFPLKESKSVVCPSRLFQEKFGAFSGRGFTERTSATDDGCADSFGESDSCLFAHPGRKI